MLEKGNNSIDLAFCVLGSINIAIAIIAIIYPDLCVHYFLFSNINVWTSVDDK